MKTIESGYCPKLNIDTDEDGDLYINQAKDYIVVDKNQARQLIEVLKEWVQDERND